MPTTARGIWTPSDTDAVDFTTHLATMAGTIDTAITNGLNTIGAGANAFKGTAAQRAAFLSTAVNGMLWQDTDSIKMIWRKDGAAWVPAVWRWSGTTAQMNAFAAPNGFEWFNTTDNSDYVRLGGVWVATSTSATITAASGSTVSAGNVSRDLVSGRVSGEIRVQRSAWTSGGVVATIPAGFRPPAVIETAGASSGVGSPAFIFLQIGSGGQVMFWGSPMPSANSWCAATFTFNGA